MKGRAKLSVIALLAIPMVVLGATLLERAFRVLPDEFCALYIPLWLVVLLACPLCGAISIGYSLVYRGSTVRTAIGLTVGLLQIVVGVHLFMGINKMISIPKKGV